MTKLAGCFGFVLIFGFSAFGQTSVVGNWYGDSICQVKKSKCSTEKVVYRIIQADNIGTKFFMHGDKIVNDKPEFMGTLEFGFDEKTKTLTGKYGTDVWKYTINGQEMEGTLTLADGTIYRRIKVTKVECEGMPFL